MSTRRRHLQVLAALTWLGCITAARADDAGPSGVVRETITAVLDIAREAGPGDAGREAAFTVVRRHFDFESMSRRVLATHWAAAGSEQRARFVALFTELLTRTYWRKIANYRGAPVEFVAERIRDDGYATVSTRVTTDTVTIPVDYRLRRTNAGWQAYDVSIEQVSLVRNYRGSFQDIIRKDGIDGLLDQLAQKVAEVPRT